eukprot:2130134-Amphidinium_carterae.1
MLNQNRTVLFRTFGGYICCVVYLLEGECWCSLLRISLGSLVAYGTLFRVKGTSANSNGSRQQPAVHVTVSGTTS